jgi:hypothetical protein
MLTNLQTPSATIVVVEGTLGQDPELPETGQNYYLVLGRIEHAGSSSNVVNSEIKQDGVTFTNNTTPEIIYKAVGGWREIDEDFTYVNAGSMTVAGDRTGMYRGGMKIKFEQDGEQKITNIVGSKFTSPTTTIYLQRDCLVDEDIEKIYISSDLAPTGIDGGEDLAEQINLYNNFYI